MLFSKGIRCFALAAAIFVVAASPAAAQDPDPLPAPPLPAPDPAPPAPAPTRPKPAPAKPAPKPAPAPVIAPAVVTPAPQTQAPAPAAPVRAKKPAAKKKPAAPKPVEPLRHLPIRDASIPATGETALVLAAAGFVPAAKDDGLGTVALAAVFWLGLAVVLLLIAYIAPFEIVPQPFGTFLYEWRNHFALVGVNMVAAAVVCYLVIATA